MVATRTASAIWRVVTPSRAASSAAGRDLHLGTRHRALGGDVGEQRVAAQRRFELGHRSVQVGFVGRKDAEGEVTLTAVVELERAQVGDRRQGGEDLVLDFGLRPHAAVRRELRNQAADDGDGSQAARDLADQRVVEPVEQHRHRGAADVEVAGR